MRDAVPPGGATHLRGLAQRLPGVLALLVRPRVAPLCPHSAPRERGVGLTVLPLLLLAFVLALVIHVTQGALEGVGSVAALPQLQAGWAEVERELGGDRIWIK